MSRAYKVVDVFTARPLLGNPVAVVLETEGLDGDSMQQIARWTNLSETTFVLPPSRPEADYRLRIFTPGSELPFAGHPTLGSAHAVIEAGQTKSSSFSEASVLNMRLNSLPYRETSSARGVAGQPSRRDFVRLS